MNVKVIKRRQQKDAAKRTLKKAWLAIAIVKTTPKTKTPPATAHPG